jgi:hypothetical protein
MKKKVEQRIKAEIGQYMWETRGQPRSASEGWAQDSYHLCEEENRPIRPSQIENRPTRTSEKSLGRTSWREQTGCPAGFGKYGNWPCGGVDPSDMKKRDIVHAVSAGHVGAPATPRVISPNVWIQRDRQKRR